MDPDYSEIANGLEQLKAAVRRLQHHSHAQVSVGEGEPPAARDFALVVTHLEDAGLRFEHGYGKLSQAMDP